jgi:hypothetical protein
MTRKHFIQFAKSIAYELDVLDSDPAIAAIQRESIKRVALVFASIASGSNDRFDRDRFLAACGF